MVFSFRIAPPQVWVPLRLSETWYGWFSMVVSFPPTIRPTVPGAPMQLPTTTATNANVTNNFISVQLVFFFSPATPPEPLSRNLTGRAVFIPAASSPNDAHPIGFDESRTGDKIVQVPHWESVDANYCRPPSLARSLLSWRGNVQIVAIVEDVSVQSGPYSLGNDFWIISREVLGRIPHNRIY